MAKPQKKKMRSSWFQKQIERSGEDFLNRKSPLDIQKEALNIVRDIMRNNITKKDFHYLFDLKILSNVKISIFEKYIESHVYDSSMSFVFQVQNGVQLLESNYGVAPENLKNTYNKNKNLLTVYAAVLQGIDSMMAFIYSDYPKAEEDYVKVYETVQYQLARFKYII